MKPHPRGAGGNPASPTPMEVLAVRFFSQLQGFHLGRGAADGTAEGFHCPQGGGSGLETLRDVLRQEGRLPENVKDASGPPRRE